MIRPEYSRIVALSLLLVIPGACGGGGGGGASVPEAPLINLPTTEPGNESSDVVTNHAFTTDHFSGSQNCSLCHDGLQDPDGNDVSIVADWQATMMANSARDPLWRAKVASEIKRNPQLQEEIETTCGRCHVPMASIELELESASAGLFGNEGLLHPDHRLFDAANEGVSCTLCHQIEDSPDLGTAAGFSGNFVVGSNFGINRVLFGQFNNPFAGPMQNQVGFTPVSSAHISSSEHCATCHNLETEVVDSQGSVTSQTFPEQMVYTEWENSDFEGSQSCQSCHLPVVNGEMAISTRPPNSLDDRAGFAAHTLVGANTYMLDILGQNAQKLNITASGFDQVITETRNLLARAASVSIDNIGRTDDKLGFTVQVTNLSGHKLPSGYPSRRVWLHISISDSSDVVVFESGAIDAMGKISGMESDEDPNGFETHYDVITSADQVQSYETIMQNLDGELTYTLLEAASYRKDNRLLPAGMDKMNVPENIKTRGAAFADSDFIGGSDRVQYQVSGLLPDTYIIRASLNYQTMAYGFGQDLFRDTDDAQVALFKDLDEKARVRFEVIGNAVVEADF